MVRIVLALTAVAIAPSAWACSCIQPDLVQSWHESTDTLGLKILGERIVGQERQFRARVVKPYSGCTQSGDIVVLTTNRDSAACGASYTVGASYVLATNAASSSVGGLPTFDVNSCGWASLYNQVSADDLDFLESRPIECNGQLTCADGQPPVACLVDPCVNASCATGTCESNTCGGQCIAEFYDANGYAQCEPW